MAAHTAPAHTIRPHAISWSMLIEATTYWAGIAAVYISYGFLWFYAAKEKLFDQDGTMPAGPGQGLRRELPRQTPWPQRGLVATRPPRGRGVHRRDR